MRQAFLKTFRFIAFGLALIAATAIADEPRAFTIADPRYQVTDFLVSHALHKWPSAIDPEKWVEVLLAYSSPSQDLEQLIIRQAITMNRLGTYYKPEILPAVSVLMTIVDEFNVKHARWVQTGHLPLIADQQVKWFEQGFYDGIEKRTTQIAVIDPVLMTLAAVMKLPDTSRILLPQSFFDHPTQTDILQFKRIFLHELHHLVDERAHGGPECEIEAELFSTKSLILIYGKQEALKIYSQFFIFPEQKNLMRDLYRKIKNIDLVQRMHAAIRNILVPGRENLAERMVNLAEAEMQSGRPNPQERGVLSMEYARSHTGDMLISYLLEASVFKVNAAAAIKKRELPSNYLELFKKFLSHPNTHVALRNESGLEAKTIETNLQIFIDMLDIVEQTAKLKPKSAAAQSDMIIGGYLEKYFQPRFQADLVAGHVQWLTAPFKISIIYPFQMQAIMAGASNQRKDPEKEPSDFEKLLVETRRMLQ